MKTLSRWFMNGLITFLPLSITVYFFWWVISWMDRIAGAPVRVWLGKRVGGESDYYLYGVGIATLVIFIIFLGFCLEFYLVKVVVNWSERIVERIPGVKTVYSSLKEIIDFFKPGKNRNSGNYMVIVTFPGDLKFLGYVTHDGLEHIKGGSLGGKDEVAVVLPFCYQMGGNTIIVPRHMVRRLDMSFEEGLKLALTGMVITSEKPGNSPRPGVAPAETLPGIPPSPDSPGAQGG
ncbi:MAG: DUF502 domain-containing protein [Planctomycetota bacterium]|jgi:uncharacterized membrane protein|nr:DUF502 domain-containing protein [Planctomycetota bacterium]